MLPQPFTPATPRVRRKRKDGAGSPPTPPPPTALALVAAAYDHAALAVTLTFDHAIDAAAVDGPQIMVIDGVFNLAYYEASGQYAMVGPQAVRLELVELGSTGSGELRLEATPDTGIVAANGGATWNGASDLQLPFP